MAQPSTVTRTVASRDCGVRQRDQRGGDLWYWPGAACTVRSAAVEQQARLVVDDGDLRRVTGGGASGIWRRGRGRRVGWHCRVELGRGDPGVAGRSVPRSGPVDPGDAGLAGGASPGSRPVADLCSLPARAPQRPERQVGELDRGSAGPDHNGSIAHCPQPGGRQRASCARPRAQRPATTRINRIGRERKRGLRDGSCWARRRLAG